MAVTIYSTLLMGALLVVIFGWMARGRDWREYRPERFTGLLEERAPRPSMDPITAFLVVLLASSAVGAAVVLGLGTVDPLMTAAAFFAPMVVSYLVAGVYIASKGRTGSSAASAATTAVVLFTVAMLAILAKLLAGA